MTVTVNINFIEQVLLLNLVFGHTVVSHGFKEFFGFKGAALIVINHMEAASEALDAAGTTLSKTVSQNLKHADFLRSIHIGI